MTATSFRIHPAIGFARLGNSEEFYLAPETSAGLPQPHTNTLGGLPIRAGTEDEPITSADLRDAKGAVRRQAARFKIFAYSADVAEAYPRGDGEEVRIGSVLGGRTVTDIVWTVHLANKKSNAYNVVVSKGPAIFDAPFPPGLRNPFLYGDADDPARCTALVIDPGPRAIRGASAAPVAFDTEAPITFANEKGEIEALPNYPRNFPTLGTNAFPAGGRLDTLGQLRTDEHGRLLVLGGYGRTFSMTTEYGTYFQFIYDVNNNGWFDDAADGPVSATLVFDDGTTAAVEGAWVVSADPAYAPQIRNVVSAWDDVYDTWIRNLGLQPEVYADDAFQSSCIADFGHHLLPIFRAAALTRWTTNLPNMAVRAHEAVGAIRPEDPPGKTILAGLVFIRNPNNPDELNVGVPLMPLSLGDTGKSFLSVTKTQYFFLTQWNAERFAVGSERPLGPGERLDYASLSNCLGGRYAPGIEMSYITRDPDIYEQDWRKTGPFRIKHKPLDYRSAVKDTPFLRGGWLPYQTQKTGLEPGDTSKFMAVPWQLDYNSCAVHQTSINHAAGAPPTADSTTLFWSWPAQRPVAVYNVADVVAGKLGKQVYSIRGPGTETTNLASVCTFQNGVDALTGWSRIGFVLQGSVIDGDQPFAADVFLETDSLLDPTPVVPWPFNASK